MGQKIHNNLKCLNLLLREDYELPVKVIISMVGVSENTWNSWVRDRRVPQQEKKELFIQKFGRATQNEHDFQGKTQKEILCDLKERYQQMCASQRIPVKESVIKAVSIEAALHGLLNEQ